MEQHQEKRIFSLIIFSCLFVTGLLSSNFLAAKIINVCGLEMPSATIAYALTYLMTDVVGELYGKQTANRVVLIGFVCLIIAAVLTHIALILPSQFDTTAFEQIFHSSTRVFIASVTAYAISQNVDVFIFHKIKGISERYKFIRNNVSTIVSQLIDTIIFSFIAFYGVVPNIFDMIYGVFVAKVFLALCDTPFFYLLTRKQRDGIL